VLTDDADLVAIERILRTAPELAYQLLQLAAVGRFGETRRHVDGIRQALVLIGLNRLRGWIPALLLRPSGRAVDTNLPAVLARARMIELLAGRLYPGRSDLGFTAGMLSALHLLIGVPASRLPGLLEIPDPLHRATFDRADPIGQLVGWAIDYQESGTTAEGSANPHAEVLARAAADAFAWATHSTELIDSRAGV
jgi:EAL and modified HD-GYP domain-containing signal transduction protein